VKKILAFIILFMIVLAKISSAQEIAEWDTAPDGSMVVTITTITKNGVQERSYKHKVLRRASKKPECNEVQIKDNELWLITQEQNPSLYIVEREPYEILEDIYIVQRPYLDWVK
jgi:hypothetical protein